MNNRKRMGDRTNPCRTPLLIGIKEEQWPCTISAVYWPEKKLEMKTQRDG